MAVCFVLSKDWVELDDVSLDPQTLTLVLGRIRLTYPWHLLFSHVSLQALTSCPVAGLHLQTFLVRAC